MTVVLELSDREVEILAELRAALLLTSDADVLRLAAYRMAREVDVLNVHPTDFGLAANRRRGARVFHGERHP